MAKSFIKFLLESDFDSMDSEQDPRERVPGEDNPTDTITLDVPLLIRLLEYAKEDAEDDMALHRVAEKLTELAGGGETLTMDDYDEIIGGDQGGDEMAMDDDDGMDMDDEMMSIPKPQRRPMNPTAQENEEVSRKAAKINKLKKDYADKMRWSRDEAAQKGRDRSGHQAGAMKIKSHLKNMYGVDV